jgi:HlyD family secretion protein
MRTRWLRWIVGVVVVAVVVAAAIYALVPRPVAVDTATVERGPLEVTINEEGTARIRDVFRVSAPIAGRLDRLPVHVGDQVYANTTIVASIRPTDPAFLDLRTRREFEAAADAARAGVALAEARVNAAVAAQKIAESDLDRAERLSGAGTISLRTYEQAVAALETANAQLDQTRAELALRRSELASATARLIEPDQPIMTPQPESCCLPVHAPVGGIVINLISESEQVVAAGAPLLEIGNPRDIEIVVPLLSADAAAMTPGTDAVVDGWGGPPLNAKVVRVAPAAYTKISALGIEEQRVDVTLEIAEPYEARRRLGHGFRVQARISIWQADDIVRVPLSALFRRGAVWAVFRVVDGRSVETPVTIDHRNGSYAEVLAGLVDGDIVVVHPSDRVADGVRVAPRE